MVKVRAPALVHGWCCTQRLHSPYKLSPGHYHSAQKPTILAAPKELKPKLTGCEVKAPRHPPPKGASA